MKKDFLEGEDGKFTTVARKLSNLTVGKDHYMLMFIETEICSTDSRYTLTDEFNALHREVLPKAMAIKSDSYRCYATLSRSLVSIGITAMKNCPCSRHSKQLIYSSSSPKYSFKCNSKASLTYWH